MIVIYKLVNETGVLSTNYRTYIELEADDIRDALAYAGIMGSTSLTDI